MKGIVNVQFPSLKSENQEVIDTLQFLQKKEIIEKLRFSVAYTDVTAMY